MGQSHAKQVHKDDHAAPTSDPVFRHEKTCYLIDKFQEKTLEILVEPSCRHMSEIGLGISQAIAATWSFHVDSVEKQAKLNNNLLTARLEVFEKSQTFIHLAEFLVNTRDDAEKVALHMMILHALIIENDGAIQFNFMRDAYGRSGDDVAWLEPRITDALGIQIQVWFHDAVGKGIIDVKGTSSTNGKPVFLPKIYKPPEHVVTMMECGGITIQSVQLAGKEAFWKCNKFR